MAPKRAFWMSRSFQLEVKRTSPQLTTATLQVKVDKNVVRMAQEVQKLEDDISAALNDQTTLQKSQVMRASRRRRSRLTTQPE